MRLYLTWRGEQGVRIAGFLARRSGWTPTREIARGTGVPRGQVPGIVADLGRSGVLVNRSGSGGGCRLAMPADEMSVRQVVEALEGPLFRDVCVLDRRRCADDGFCALHEAWTRAQSAVLEALDSVSLASLAADERSPVAAGGGR